VVSADSKDELADKIKAAIEKQIPNMEIEFTQPSKCVSTN
jgi:cobalt-zinc-cadmium resistance protein CzcA